MPDPILTPEEYAYLVKSKPVPRPSWQRMMELAARASQPASQPESVFATDAPPPARATSIFAGDAPLPSLPPTPATPASKKAPWQEMAEAAQRLGGRVTSTTGGKHNVGSKHPSGGAIDIGAGQETLAQQEKIASGMRNDGYLVFDERRRPKGQKEWGGPHFHVEKAPFNVRAAVDDFLRRRRTTSPATATPAENLQKMGLVQPPVQMQDVMKAKTTPAKPAGSADHITNPQASLNLNFGPKYNFDKSQTVESQPTQTGAQAKFSKLAKGVTPEKSTERQTKYRALEMQASQEVDNDLTREAERAYMENVSGTVNAMGGGANPSVMLDPARKQAFIATYLTEQRGDANNMQRRLNEKLYPKLVANFPEVAKADQERREQSKQKAIARRKGSMMRPMTDEEASRQNLLGAATDAALTELAQPVGSVVKAGLALTPNALVSKETKEAVRDKLFPGGRFLGPSPEDQFIDDPEAAVNDARAKSLERAKTIGSVVGGVGASVAEALPTGKAAGAISKALRLPGRVAIPAAGAMAGGAQALLRPEVYRNDDSFFELTGGRGKYQRDAAGKIVTDERGQPVIVPETSGDALARALREGIVSGAASGLSFRPGASGSLAQGRMIERSTLGQIAADAGTEFAGGAILDPITDPSLAGKQKPLDQNLLDTFAEILPELVRVRGIRMGTGRIATMQQSLRNGQVPPEVASIVEEAVASSAGAAGTPVVGTGPEPSPPVSSPTAPLFAKLLARDATGQPAVVDPNLDPLAQQMARLESFVNPQAASVREKAVAAEEKYIQAVAAGEPQTIAAVKKEYLKAANAYLATLPIEEQAAFRSTPEWKALTSKSSKPASSPPATAPAAKTAPAASAETAPVATPTADPNRDLSGVELAALRKRLSPEEILTMTPAEARQVLYGRPKEAAPAPPAATPINPNSIQAKLQAIKERRAQESAVQSGNERTANQNGATADDQNSNASLVDMQPAQDGAASRNQDRIPAQESTPANNVETRPLSIPERYTLTRQLGYSAEDLKAMTPAEGRGIIAQNTAKPREQIELERRQRQFNDAVVRGDKPMAERESAALVTLLEAKKRQTKDATVQANLAEQITAIKQQVKGITSPATKPAASPKSPALRPDTIPAQKQQPQALQVASGPITETLVPPTVPTQPKPAKRDITDRENAISLIRKNGGIRVTENNEGEFRDLARQYPGLTSRNNGIGEDQMIDVLRSEGYDIPAEPGALASFLGTYKQSREQQQSYESQVKEEKRYADLGKNGYELYDRVASGDEAAMDEFDAYMENVLKFPRNVRQQYLEEAQAAGVESANERTANQNGATADDQNSNASLVDMQPAQDGAASRNQERVPAQESVEVNTSESRPAAVREAQTEEVDRPSEADLLERKRQQSLMAERAEVRALAQSKQEAATGKKAGPFGKLKWLGFKELVDFETGELRPGLVYHPAWQEILDLPPDASEQDVFNAIAQDLAGQPMASLMSPKDWLEVADQFGPNKFGDLKASIDNMVAHFGDFQKKIKRFAADEAIETAIRQIETLPPNGKAAEAARAELLKYLESEGINEQASVSNLTDNWIKTYIAERVAHRSARASTEQSTGANLSPASNEVRPALESDQGNQPPQSQPEGDARQTDRGSRAEQPEPQPEPVNPQQNQQQVAKPKTRQLSSDFREYAPEEQGGLFVSSLKKGDTFRLNDGLYTVKSRSEKQIQIKVDKQGKESSLTIKTRYKENYGNSKVNTFFRDIEGQITIDLINENNPFHTPSVITQKAKQRLAEVVALQQSAKQSTPTERTIAHQQPQLDGAKVVAETPNHLVVEKPDGAETLVKKDSAHLKEEETPALTTDELASVQRKFDTLKAESAKSGQPLDGAIDDFLSQTTMFGEQFTEAQANALRDMAKKEPKTPTTPTASTGSLFDIAPTQETKLAAEIERRKKEDAKRQADAPPPLFAQTETPKTAEPAPASTPEVAAEPVDEVDAIINSPEAFVVTTMKGGQQRFWPHKTLRSAISSALFERRMQQQDTQKGRRVTSTIDVITKADRDAGAAPKPPLEYKAQVSEAPADKFWDALREQGGETTIEDIVLKTRIKRTEAEAAANALVKEKAIIRSSSGASVVIVGPRQTPGDSTPVKEVVPPPELLPQATPEVKFNRANVGTYAQAEKFLRQSGLETSGLFERNKQTGITISVKQSPADEYAEMPVIRKGSKILTQDGLKASPPYYVAFKDDLVVISPDQQAAIESLRNFDVHSASITRVDPDTYSTEAVYPFQKEDDQSNREFIANLRKSPSQQADTAPLVKPEAPLPKSTASQDRSPNELLRELERGTTPELTEGERAMVEKRLAGIKKERARKDTPQLQQDQANWEKLLGQTVTSLLSPEMTYKEVVAWAESNGVKIGEALKQWRGDGSKYPVKEDGALDIRDAFVLDGKKYVLRKNTENEINALEVATDQGDTRQSGKTWASAEEFKKETGRDVVTVNADDWKVLEYARNTVARGTNPAKKISVKQQVDDLVAQGYTALRHFKKNRKWALENAQGEQIDLGKEQIAYAQLVTRDAKPEATASDILPVGTKVKTSDGTTGTIKGYDAKRNEYTVDNDSDRYGALPYSANEVELLALPPKTTAPTTTPATVDTKAMEETIKASLNPNAGRAFMLEDFAQWMAGKIATGVKSLRDLTRTAINTFGPRIRPHIQKAWNLLKEFAADERGVLDEQRMIGIIKQGLIKSGIAEPPKKTRDDVEKSPEFKKWSRGAPVVRREAVKNYDFQTGVPVIVEAVHGYGRQSEFWPMSFSEFQPRKLDSKINNDKVHRLLDVVYFTDDAMRATHIATRMQYQNAPKENAQILPVYVRFNNPKVITGGLDALQRVSKKEIESWKDRFDGVIIKDVWHDQPSHDHNGNLQDQGYRKFGRIEEKQKTATYFAAFSPTQIKSVFNRGTFDPTTPNISSMFGVGAFKKFNESNDPPIKPRDVRKASDGKRVNTDELAGLLPKQSQTLLDAEKYAKEAAQKLLDAYKDKTLPLSRALKIADRLKLEGRAQKLRARQGEFVSDTVELINQMVLDNAVLKGMAASDAKFAEAKRRQKMTLLKLKNQLSKAGEYTKVYAYPARIGRAMLLAAFHILEFNILNQAADAIPHEMSKLMPAPSKWLKAATGGEVEAPKFSLTANMKAAGVVLEEMKNLLADAANKFQDPKSRIAQTFAYGESDLLVNQDIALQVYQQMHAKALPKSSQGGAEKFELGNREKGLGPISEAINVIHRMHGAADVPGRLWAYTNALTALAEQQAKDLGKQNNLDASQIKELTRQIALNPSPAQILVAASEANNFVLDVETMLHAGFEGFKQKITGMEKLRIQLDASNLTAAEKKQMEDQMKNTKRYKAGAAFNSLIIDNLIPFTKIPTAAVVSKFYRYTPLAIFGSGYKLRQMAKDRKAGYAIDPIAAIDSYRNIQKGTFGTLTWLLLGALSAWGWYELIHGDDNRPRMRAALEALGYDFEPEMYVPDAGAAIRLKAGGTIGGQLAAAARIKNAMQTRTNKEGKPEDASSAYLRGTGALLDTMVQDTPVGRAASDALSGVKDLSEGRFSGASLARNTATRLIPGVVREAAQVMDDKRRVVDNKNGMATAFKESLQVGVPGLREQLPARVNALGKETEQRNPFAIFRSLSPDARVKQLQEKGVGLPTLKREEGESTAAYNERMRAFGALTEKAIEKIGAADVPAKVLNDTLTAQGVKRANVLSPKSVQAELTNDAAKLADWEKITSDPRYQALSDDEKQKLRAKFSANYAKFSAEVKKQKREAQKARVMPESARNRAIKQAERAMR